MKKLRQIKIFSVGDYVVSDLFKTCEGFPYVIKITKVDDDFGVVEFDYKGETGYIGTDSLRIATKFERFFGPIYDFILK
jgi:hypothetical protein